MGKGVFVAVTLLVGARMVVVPRQCGNIVQLQMTSFDGAVNLRSVVDNDRVKGRMRSEGLSMEMLEG